jgi:TolA-binding protein
MLCSCALAFASGSASVMNKTDNMGKSRGFVFQLQRAYSRQCEELKLLRKQLANRERRIRELEEQVQTLQLQQRKAQFSHK